MTRPRVYLDSNVFISAYENNGARSDHAWWLLHSIEDGEFIAVTSEITLAEVLVRPVEERDYALSRQYQDVISPAEYLEVSKVTRPILLEAAALRSVRRALRLPDAIHVASARLSGCRHIVSDDQRLTSTPGLELVHLGPHTVNTIRMTQAP